MLDSKLKTLGLKSSKSDPCIYFINQENNLIILLVYVDDILIAGNNIDKINEIKDKLKDEFDIKDLGEAKFCLGIEIVRKEDNITLIQEIYIEEAIRKFGMENAKGVDTPASVGDKLPLSESIIK